MRVRDKTLKQSEYKGRWTDASDRECPCRPCYNAHDCGYSTYGGHVVRMMCASRENGGCGTKPEPQHIYSGSRGYVCKRCGARRGHTPCE